METQLLVGEAEPCQRRLDQERELRHEGEHREERHDIADRNERVGAVRQLRPHKVRISESPHAARERRRKRGIEGIGLRELRQSAQVGGVGEQLAVRRAREVCEARVPERQRLEERVVLSVRVGECLLVHPHAIDDRVAASGAPRGITDVRRERLARGDLLEAERPLHEFHVPARHIDEHLEQLRGDGGGAHEERAALAEDARLGRARHPLAHAPERVARLDRAHAALRVALRVGELPQERVDGRGRQGVQEGCVFGVDARRAQREVGAVLREPPPTAGAQRAAGIVEPSTRGVGACRGAGGARTVRAALTVGRAWCARRRAPTTAGGCRVRCRPLGRLVHIHRFGCQQRLEVGLADGTRAA